MPLTYTQQIFLSKHLGVSVAAEAAVAVDQAGSGSRAKLMAIWGRAKEKTDPGIGALQNALRSYGNIDLNQIAESGLNGVTEGNSVAMMRALMEYDAADAPKRAAAANKLLKQVDAYQGFLDSSRLIKLVEGNPFGVSVSIKVPLSAALKEIAAEVAR